MNSPLLNEQSFRVRDRARSCLRARISVCVRVLCQFSQHNIFIYKSLDSPDDSNLIFAAHVHEDYEQFLFSILSNEKCKNTEREKWPRKH